MIRKIILTLALLAALSSWAAPRRGFAIFVDSASNAQAATQLEAYRGAVDRQGLKAEIVVLPMDITPDSLRSIITSMAGRSSHPIEGMVLVGDVPVPMILDAQHLTSAFKVAQNPKRLERSSVPSDRFYDDLNLQFEFVAKDPGKNLYYYSLTPESPQMSRPQLYSGRIKSTDFYGRDKYENLRHYLTKLVRIKDRREKMDEMLFFSGSGYNSESILARIDEKQAHLEQFPWLKQQASKLHFMDHRNARFAKYPLMSRLQHPEISIALLHHHGAPTKEYINRYPEPRNAQDQIAAAKQFFRSKIRAAVDKKVPLDSAKARYARDYGVPVEWFADVMDSASIAADSAYDEKLDLYLHDFDRYTPNARVVILDACFNGAFNNDIFIADAYIFGNGDCVAVIANSVNSLQDKLPDKNIGLLGLGMRVGEFVRYNPYLESHVIGDPTFAFTPYEKLPFDINDALASGDVKLWKKQLAQSPYPAIQAMALQQLSLADAVTPAELLEVMRTSPNYLTRLSALMELSASGSPEFVKAIKLGLNDSYELIRRFSASFAGKNGSPELIPPLISSYADAFKGDRVNFQLLMAMPLFDYDLLIAELERQKPFRHDLNEQEAMEKARADIASRYSSRRWTQELDLLSDTAASPRDVRQFVRQLRNNPIHSAATKLVTYIYTCPDARQQVELVEALGWFNHSYRAPEIADALTKVADDEALPAEVRKEARKTVARLRKK